MWSLSLSRVLLSKVRCEKRPMKSTLLVIKGIWLTPWGGPGLRSPVPAPSRPSREEEERAAPGGAGTGWGVGGAGGEADSSPAPAFAAHSFVVGELRNGEFHEDPKHCRVNPYEAIFLRPGAELCKAEDLLERSPGRRRPQELPTPYTPMSKVGWTDEAREAALEARRRRAGLHVESGVGPWTDDPEKVRTWAQGLAEKSGLPGPAAAKITAYPGLGKKFVRGGREMQQSGAYNSQTGELHLYMDSYSKEQMTSILSHEMTHHKFTKVMAVYQEEYEQVLDERARMIQEEGLRVTPQQSLEIRKPDRRKYPVLSAVRESAVYMEPGPSVASEGYMVSPYAAKYWEEATNGTISSAHAVNETTAEVARLRERAVRAASGTSRMSPTEADAVVQEYESLPPMWKKHERIIAALYAGLKASKQ